MEGRSPGMRTTELGGAQQRHAGSCRSCPGNMAIPPDEAKKGVGGAEKRFCEAKTFEARGEQRRKWLAGDRIF
jgi:hypothetical protein